MKLEREKRKPVRALERTGLNGVRKKGTKRDRRLPSSIATDDWQFRKDEFEALQAQVV
jgi:hypothetical protein